MACWTLHDKGPPLTTLAIKSWSWKKKKIEFIAIMRQLGRTDTLEGRSSYLMYISPQLRENIYLTNLLAISLNVPPHPPKQK